MLKQWQSQSHIKKERILIKIRIKNIGSQCSVWGVRTYADDPSRDSCNEDIGSDVGVIVGTMRGDSEGRFVTKSF